MYANLHDTSLHDTRHPLVQKWYPIKLPELQIFLPILIYIGLLKGASLEIFWRPIGGVVSEQMCKMRYIHFLQLKHYLHIFEPSKASIATWPEKWGPTGKDGNTIETGEKSEDRSMSGGMQCR